MGMFDDLVAQYDRAPTRITVGPDAVVPPPELTGTATARSFTRGAKDVVDEGAALLTRGLEGIAPEGSWFQQYMQGQRELVDRLNAEGQAEYAAANPEAGMDIPRVLGNAAAAAPVAMAVPGATAPSLAARTTSGVVGGALTGVLQPADPTKPDYWSQKKEQAVYGAVGGGIAPAIAGSAARVISPNISPEVQSLRRQGAQLTPGQTMGGTYNRVEEGLQSIPLVGDVVKGARTRALESLNRTTINRALEPIGQRLPNNIPIGRQAVDHAHRTISDAYDTLLPQLRVRADPQLVGNLQSIIANSQHLEPGLADTFANILRTKLFSRFSPNGGMTGNDFKIIESELGRLAKNYASSADAGQRELGGALRQVQAEVRDLLVRSNPNHAQSLNNINTSWANLIRIEDAAGRTGNQQGVFTPAQLGAAVRKADPSIRKGAYARGNAMMQDLSDQAQSVLGNKVPDSGTPFRSMVGLGTLGGGAYLEPSVGLPMAAGAGLLSAAYTRPGNWLINHLLATRPAAAAPVASVVRRNPLTTPFGAALLAGSSNQ